MQLRSGLLQAVWLPGLLVMLVLAGMNVFFFSNWQLFSLLEKEDWPALAAYLEKKIFREGRYSNRNVKILAQAYLVLGNLEGTIRLENETANAKPALLERNALIFGAGRILKADRAGGDPAAAADFYKARLQKDQANKGWLRWYYGFSLILAKSFNEAEAIFEELAAGAGDPQVAGLSAFFLSKILKKTPSGDEQQDRAKANRGRLRASIKNIETWNKKTAKLKTDVHGAIVRNYLDEVGAWIFEKD